jgi:hypothetical protein
LNYLKFLFSYFILSNIKNANADNKSYYLEKEDLLKKYKRVLIKYKSSIEINSKSTKNLLKRSYTIDKSIKPLNIKYLRLILRIFNDDSYYTKYEGY